MVKIVALRAREKIGDIAGKRPGLVRLQRGPAVSPHFFAAQQDNADKRDF
jgi:hypothetical protein